MSTEEASVASIAMAACPICHQCPICRKTAAHPVVTSCGHTFCWPCLAPWLHNPPKPCPICRTMLTSTVDIIPVYGSHGNDGSLSTSGVPPRPRPPASNAPLRAGEFPKSQASALLALDAVEMMNNRVIAVTNLAVDGYRARLRAAESERAEMERDPEDWDPELREMREGVEWLLGRMERKLREKRNQSLRIVQESTRLVQPLASLRRLIARANDDLPDWWPAGENSSARS